MPSLRQGNDVKMRVIKGRSGNATARGTNNFTGEVWTDGVLLDDPELKVNTVIFTPCARTYWHYHEGGQILQVFRGRGFVCAEGGDPVELVEGDVVWTPPGERHWHGGGKDSLMGHTAFSLGATVWLEEVSDADYDAAAN